MQHRIRSKIKKVPQGFSKKKWKPNNWIPMFTYLQIGMHRNIHDLPQIWNSLFIWISRILNENAPEFLQNKYLLSIKFLKSDILNWLVCYKHCIKFVDTHTYFVSKYKPSFPKFWTDCCGSKKYKYPNLKEFEIISSLYNWWFELIHNPHLGWVLSWAWASCHLNFHSTWNQLCITSWDASLFQGCKTNPTRKNRWL